MISYLPSLSPAFIEPAAVFELATSVYRQNPYPTREVFPIVGATRRKQRFEVADDMRTRLIAFGNTMLSDDGVGICLARAVGAVAPELEVVESEVGGLALLELLEGCERAVLLDAVKLSGRKPGELVPLALAEARCCSRLAGVHEVDLAGVLAIAERLGRQLPREILLFGVQGDDLTHFAERLTPRIEAALPRLVVELLAAIDER